MRFYIITLLPILICHCENKFLDVDNQYLAGHLEFSSLFAGKTINIAVYLEYKQIPTTICKYGFYFSNFNLNDCFITTYYPEDSITLNHVQ